MEKRWVSRQKCPRDLCIWSASLAGRTWVRVETMYDAELGDGLAVSTMKSSPFTPRKQPKEKAGSTHYNSQQRAGARPARGPRPLPKPRPTAARLPSPRVVATRRSGGCSASPPARAVAIAEGSYPPLVGAAGSAAALPAEQRCAARRGSSHLLPARPCPPHSRPRKEAPSRAGPRLLLVSAGGRPPPPPSSFVVRGLAGSGPGAVPRHLRRAAAHCLFLAGRSRPALSGAPPRPLRGPLGAQPLGARPGSSGSIPAPPRVPPRPGGSARQERCRPP